MTDDLADRELKGTEDSNVPGETTEEIEDELNSTEPPQEEEIEEDPTAELENRYLRLLADFDNFKRRTAKEKENIYKYANQGLIEALLPILDAFEMAEKSLPASPDESLSQYADGVANIQRQLLEALEKTGLKRIDALGKIYDPVYHEAIMVEEDSSVPDQTIIDELRPGYEFKDRVMRPTVCRVATGAKE